MPAVQRLPQVAAAAQGEGADRRGGRQRGDVLPQGGAERTADRVGEGVDVQRVGVQVLAAERARRALRRGPQLDRGELGRVGDTAAAPGALRVGHQRNPVHPQGVQVDLEHRARAAALAGGGGAARLDQGVQEVRDERGRVRPRTGRDGVSAEFDRVPQIAVPHRLPAPGQAGPARRRLRRRPEQRHMPVQQHPGGAAGRAGAVSSSRVPSGTTSASQPRSASRRARPAQISSSDRGAVALIGHPGGQQHLDRDQPAGGQVRATDGRHEDVVAVLPQPAQHIGPAAVAAGTGRRLAVRRDGTGIEVTQAPGRRCPGPAPASCSRSCAWPSRSRSAATAATVHTGSAPGRTTTGRASGPGSAPAAPSTRWRAGRRGRAAPRDAEVRRRLGQENQLGVVCRWCRGGPAAPWPDRRRPAAARDRRARRPARPGPLRRGRRPLPAGAGRLRAAAAVGRPERLQHRRRHRRRLRR